MPTKIEISHRTIIFTAFFLFSLWFLFQIRQIILSIYVASMLMAALNPLVMRLERLRIPRTWAILLCYFCFLAIFGVILGSLMPSLVLQTKKMLEYLPFLAERFDFTRVDQNAISGQLISLPERLLKFFASLFSNFVSLFVVMVITFYLLMERKRMNRYLLVFFGNRGNKKAQEIITKIETQIGAWVRGQVILGLAVGLMTYLGLRLLAIDFALPLALLAALLEIIPNLGPTLAAIPAIFIGLAVQPLSGLAVAALYFLVQQLENYFMVPSVMGRVVNLSPLIVIISLMIGFKIGGIAGAVLAIPTVLILRIILLEVSSSKHFQEA